MLPQPQVEGGGYWYCFRQTSSNTAGTFLLMLFLLVILLMLLNTLIAMMEDTYIKVNEESFPNYAASFGKVGSRISPNPPPAHPPARTPPRRTGGQSRLVCYSFRSTHRPPRSGVRALDPCT